MTHLRSTLALTLLLAASIIAVTGPALVGSAAAEPQRRGTRTRQPAEEPPAPAAPEPESESAPAPEQEAAQEPAAPPPTPGLFVGPASCAASSCHGSAAPRDVFAALQNEYYTWLDQDPHSRAFEVLAEPRSRTIAANLGLPEPATESRLCLDCHTLAPPPRLRRGSLEVADGVSCEACHGPASGWLAGHHTAGWSRDDALAAGLVDLSDAERRAALCLGCHAGVGARRVDHRLLAAGHPQLVFELDNYTAGLPAHWPPPAQYGEDRAAAVAAGRGPRAWAVGQAAAFGAALERLAERPGAGTGTGTGPDFGVLRCTDCHHSLAEERWRGEGADRSALGMPRWSPAQWAVLRHLVGAFAPRARAGLDQRVAALADTVGRLAPAAEVAAEARATAAALDAVSGRIAAARWDPERSAAMLLSLAADRGAATADRETAEQFFLAMNTLTSDLLSRRPGLASGAMIGSLEDMARTLDDPHALDRSRFAEHLERFETQARAALAREEG